MFLHRQADKLVVPIIVGLVFVASSYRGKYHLQADMPDAFFSANTKAGDVNSTNVARAYWSSARAQVQWQYPYGHPLPPDPPAEFQISSARLGSAAADPTTRLLYWHRLQLVWYLPETWRKDYGWDFTWLSDPLSSGATWLKDEANRIFSVK